MACAANTRAKFPFQADIPYGPHPREILDFFRPPKSRATLIFIHGGYWRGLSKIETSWIADGFLDQDISVVLINYPLCPDVGIADIGHSVCQAFAHLYKHVLNEDERGAIVVSGHSAGGYLAALHLATDWTGFGLPQNPIAGVIGISGIYDVAPLIHTKMNRVLGITPESARKLNLVKSGVKSSAKLLLAVGQEEPQEFYRQMDELAATWKQLNPKTMNLPGANHFTVLDQLSDPAGEINKIACSMLSSFR